MLLRFRFAMADLIAICQLDRSSMQALKGLGGLTCSRRPVFAPSTGDRNLRPHELTRQHRHCLSHGISSFLFRLFLHVRHPPPPLGSVLMLTTAPLVAIVGGVIGGVLVLGVIITAALCKTGHLMFKRGGSSREQAGAAPADGSATAGTQYPVAGPVQRGTHYPSAGPAERGTHYPSVVQYPQPA